MRKLALSLALCAAAVLGLPGSISAQRSGGGYAGGGARGGSFGGAYAGYAGGYRGAPSGAYYGGGGLYGRGGYYGGGAYYGHGGYYGRPYYGGGSYGYGGFYFGSGFGISIGLPLFSYPWGYSRYDYGYRAPYYMGSYYYGPVESYTPGPAAGQQDESMDPNAAHVEVRLPENATLWILGQKTQQTGAVRQFYSAPLTPGKTHTYEFKARWTDADGKAVERTKKIDLKPGAWLGIDFNRQEL